MRRLGVKIETDVVVGRTVTVDELFENEGFKAVFIGSGAGLPKFMGIPGENLNGVFPPMSSLPVTILCTVMTLLMIPLSFQAAGL